MQLHGTSAALVPSWMRSANAIRDDLMRTMGTKEMPESGGAARLPLDATDETIYQAADEAARSCYKICALYMNAQAIIFAIDEICNAYGIPKPLGATDAEIIARAIDKSWWLRNLRKEHGRRFENHQIKIGVTSSHKEPYISNVSCIKQAQRNRENQALLEAQKVTNGMQEYTLAQLAALGQANKAIRRGELMTRIRGFEEIAQSLGHVGMFWTLTCPSKFHSVGGTNAKYQDKTPREAQAYLCRTWARIRASLKRQNIRPYGFRIAEPHTDGCPHWHMLFFVPREHVAAMEMVIYSYAMQEDETEAGCNDYRVTCKMIESGNGKSAAAYIAKYIAKNIDGYAVGQHTAKEWGTTYYLQKDLLGNEVLTPSMRVTYWSQKHGIRQFQQIGGAPVGVWRELRRMTLETVASAPDEILKAYHAAQKVNTGEQDEAGNDIFTQASWKDYIEAQGGVGVGRAHLIRLAHDLVTIEGKYATKAVKKPIGVMAADGDIYKSVRYTWERAGIKKVLAVAFDLPRTCVNNCTESNFSELRAKFEKTGKVEEFKNMEFCGALNWEEVETELLLDRITEREGRKNAYAGRPVVSFIEENVISENAIQRSGRVAREYREIK